MMHDHSILHQQRERIMKSRAVFFAKAGEAEVREIDVPDPSADEVQVESIVNGICMWEVWLFKSGAFDASLRPGHEGVGVVTKAGSSVRSVVEGDFVTTDHWSEILNRREGSFIKLGCTAEQAKSFLVEPVSCAVNAAAYVGMYPGDRVILFGMGYMGLLLLQIVARSPFSRIVVVDIKDSALAQALAYGAHETINSSTAEGAARLAELCAQPFDIAYECSAAATSLEWCTKLLREGGRLGLYAWHHGSRSVDTTAWHVKGLQVLNVAPGITSNERRFRSFEAADALMRAGIVDQSKLITHRYSIEDIQRGMVESTARPDGFVKSVVAFG
jgi:threonine dehydrogenase-like Zn-dependent dehydrogenase